MTDDLCDARIRPFPSSVLIECGLPDGHPEFHSGVLRDYAYPGSATTISWAEDDRRNFRGAWTPCPADCTLPNGHRGNHVP